MGVICTVWSFVLLTFLKSFNMLKSRGYMVGVFKYRSQRAVYMAGVSGSRSEGWQVGNTCALW